MIVGSEEAAMTLGERCDEIVKLIDETLVALGAVDPDGTAGGTHPQGASAPRTRPASGARPAAAASQRSRLQRAS